MATSRRSVGEMLVALLSVATTGAGQPVHTVTRIKQDSVLDKWPLVGVMSAGSARENFFLGGGGNIAAFNFNVIVLVRQTDDASGWTHTNAIDRLDEIEAAIAAVYEDETNNRDDWEVLKLSADTTIREVMVEGVPFYLELIPTTAKLVTN